MNSKIVVYPPPPSDLCLVLTLLKYSLSKFSSFYCPDTSAALFALLLPTLIVIWVFFLFHKFSNFTPPPPLSNSFPALPFSISPILQITKLPPTPTPQEEINCPDVSPIQCCVYFLLIWVLLGGGYLLKSVILCKKIVYILLYIPHKKPETKYKILIISIQPKVLIVIIWHFESNHPFINVNKIENYRLWLFSWKIKPFTTEFERLPGDTQWQWESRLRMCHQGKGTRERSLHAACRLPGPWGGVALYGSLR